MILLDLLLKPVDFIAAPICFIILWMIFSFVVRKYKDQVQRRLYLKAFYFKMLFALLFTLMCTFYYRSGDTEMYYEATLLLNKAVVEDPDNLWVILLTKKLTFQSPFLSYFLYTGSRYPVFQAMMDPGNFMAPKLALIPSLIFGKSYLCISMCFAFFALGGALRLYKFFTHYYPKYYREIALATLFLPSVTLWSSGLMKDPICFGALGYLVYGIFNIFIKRQKIFTSILWISLSVFLLFYTKVYILLAIAPAVLIWLFREVNKVVQNKTLRGVMGVLTLSLGIFLALRLVNYVTSDESLAAFRLDSIAEFSEHNRNLYEGFSEREEGSYFTIKTGNPVLLIFNGIVATLYRPFLWEINGITALLSALEALFFLYLTLYFFIKKGIKTFFKYIFSQPILFLCLIFSLVFAAAVGSTALNFGSLSRYKIPCLPFYLVMLFVLYQEHKIQFPTWLKKILGYKTLPAWMDKTKPQFS
jgi:hypothetical protein